MRYLTLGEAAAAVRQASQSRPRDGARQHEEHRAAESGAQAKPSPEPASRPAQRSSAPQR
jgi:hypothetical protein